MSDLATTRLAELETVIERGQQTFVEVGNALMEIRDQRLYRKTHATFEAYCKERWGWTRRQANRQIDAAKVVETLGPTGPKPATEREARDMLDGLEPEERREVREGKATPATVEHLAEVKVPKTKRTAGDESKEPSPQENLDEVLKDARICAIILRDAVHQIVTRPRALR